METLVHLLEQLILKMTSALLKPIIYNHIPAAKIAGAPE